MQVQIYIKILNYIQMFEFYCRVRIIASAPGVGIPNAQSAMG